MTSQIHEEPTTPGWQLLLTAAQAALDNVRDQRIRASFFANLIARRHELIPAGHKTEVIQLTLSAALAVASDGVRLYGPAVEFFNAQIGREKFAELLGSNWTFRDSGDDTPGYIAVIRASNRACEEFEQKRFLRLVSYAMTRQPA